MSEASNPLTEIVARGDRPTAIEYARCILHVVDGPDSGTQAELETSSMRIGTSPGCDLVLQDSTVSRRHCELEVDARGFRLRDLDSTNGTFVSGLRIGSVYLRPGTVFRIGKTSLKLQVLDERVSIRLSDQDGFGDVLGASVRMREIFYLLEKIAAKDVTVLLLGETGTGKEVFAQSIHKQSPRRKKTFIPIDCGAIPENLIEAELFGHARGAFTGADSDRAGAFEAASGGTVFLDEIGELPLAQQTKLLRVIESREVKRLGENKNRPIDTRIIAATNRSLAEEVETGAFRKDLYYRLSVVEIEIPPLRNRPEDIPLLAQHFLNQMARNNGDRVPGITPEALSVLSGHEWPGNVRELRNVLERAWVLADHDEIDAATILAGSEAFGGQAGHMTFELDGKEAYASAREKFERAYVIALLRENDFNVSQAARVANIQRPSLHRLMKKHGIKVQDLKPS